MKIKLDILDKLFARFVKLRADYHCEYCGKRGWMETSHFHSRRKFSTRYDPDNACCLCSGCHRFLGEHPNIHSEFFRKRLGSKRYEELNIRAQQIIKRTPQAETEIKQSLQEKLKILEGDR